MKRILFALFAISTLVSCDRFEFVGKGDVITRELSLPVIERFALDGSFDVFVNQGPSQTIVVEGEENIIDRLKMEVDNGRWDIQLKRGSYSDFSLTIYITVPDIREMIIDGSGDVFIDQMTLSNLQLRTRASGDFIITNLLDVSNNLDLIVEGSGDISINQLEGENISVDIEGSGDVSLNGGVRNATYYIDGSGDIQAFSCTTVTCTAITKSSGDIELTAQAELDVQIDASGNVLYKGDPNISQKITGSGKLINRN